MNELISANPDVKERLIRLALDGLASRHTCRAYRAALDEFLTWSQGQQPAVMSKALVHRYKAMLIEKELAPATINQRLAAVRRLSQEAGDNGLLDASVAAAILKVCGIRPSANRTASAAPVGRPRLVCEFLPRRSTWSNPFPSSSRGHTCPQYGARRSADLQCNLSLRRPA